MVKIFIEDGKIEAKGHAMYGPVGCDIVCAGVSTLIQTALQSIINQKNLTIKNNVIEEGYVLIEWKGKANCLDTITTGLELIAEEYPENVKINRGELHF